MFEIRDLSKSFRLHHQGGIEIPVMKDAGFSVSRGECVALTGPSGVGKSTVLRLLYGNYLLQEGQIRIDDLDLGKANSRDILAMRHHQLGYVSQFLRVLPRISTLQVVTEPMRNAGMPNALAERRAKNLLEQLRIPPALWDISPLTFSGGEQQRVNIARGMGPQYPALLLDEPTASLDQQNRATVLELIREAKTNGAAIIGIFHDAAAREAVCDREIDVGAFRPSVSACTVNEHQ